MNSWNGFDFFVFLILAYNTIRGMSRGATKEIVSMLCLSVGLIFTIKFTVPLAAFFNRSPSIVDVVNNTFIQNFMAQINAGPLTADLLKQIFYSLSLLICFLGSFSICEGALSISGFMETYSFPYAALNRKVGAGLGFVRGYVFSLILIAILGLHIFTSNNQSSFLSGSFFVSIFQSGAVQLDSLIAQQKPESYKDILKQQTPYTPEQLLKDLNHSNVNFNPGHGQTPNQNSTNPYGTTNQNSNTYNPYGTTNQNSNQNASPSNLPAQ